MMALCSSLISNTYFVVKTCGCLFVFQQKKHQQNICFTFQHFTNVSYLGMLRFVGWINQTQKFQNMKEYILEKMSHSVVFWTALT